jgi:hypothetical protein
LLSGPKVIEDDVESNIKECTSEVSGGSKFTSSADNFEYFPLDFAFKICVENIAVGFGLKDFWIRCDVAQKIKVSVSGQI